MNDNDSCEMAIQAAMEVIGKACREGKVEVHMGYPKESCRGFLLNIGDSIEQKFFSKSRSKLNIESIDTDVFDIKRMPVREGFICEGRLRFVYLANKGIIDVERLKLEWLQLNTLMKGAGISLLLTLVKQMYRGGARILNIEIVDVVVSSDPEQREQADVDLLMKITVSISKEDMETEEYDFPEKSVEVMQGRQGESIEQIIKDMHNAYEKGIDKYILVADNGEKIILNVQSVMGEPREDNFESFLKGYINRLLIHPEEG